MSPPRFEVSAGAALLAFGSLKPLHIGWSPMLRDTKVALEVDSLLFDVLPLVSFPICQGAYDV